MPITNGSKIASARKIGDKLAQFGFEDWPSPRLALMKLESPVWADASFLNVRRNEDHYLARMGKRGGAWPTRAVAKVKAQVSFSRSQFQLLLKRSMYETGSLVASMVAAVGLCLMGQAARADDAADAKAAVKKLADAPSYTWASTTENVAAAGGGGGGRGRGRGGARRRAASRQGREEWLHHLYADDHAAALRCGDPGDKAVAKMSDGWKTKEDLQKAVTAAAGGGGGGGGGFGGGGGGGGGGGFGPEFQVLNQINSFKSPVQQATEVADKMTNVKKTADGYTADLATDTAKTLATPQFGRGGAPGGGAAGGAPAFEVSGAKGTMAITVKDGVATKLVIHPGRVHVFQRQRHSDPSGNTTIEIKDVGSTKQDVPAEAKAKLDSIK